MLVLVACINIQIVQQFSSKRTFGQHTLYNSSEQSVTTIGLCHQLGRSHFTLAARVTCVAEINLFIPLVASHFYFVSIDNNHVVTTIYMRSKIGFVLSAPDFCDL